MVFLSILDKETGPPHADFISSLYLDENNFRERWNQLWSDIKIPRGSGMQSQAIPSYLRSEV